MTEDRPPTSNGSKTQLSSTLSKRAHGYMKSSPTWTSAVGKVFADRYDKDKNPDGYINLGVAENVLLQDALRERIGRQRKSIAVDPQLFGYGPFGGSVALRTELKRLFEELLMPGVSLSVDNIVIGNGSGPVLEQLAFLLSDAGDVFIVPAPYYMGFELDMQTRAGAKVVPWEMRMVKISDATATEPEKWRYELDFDALDALYREHGSRVRGLIWTNPHNPTGQIFPEQDTKRVLRWCIARSIAVISDEVYGLSVYNSSGSDSHKFVSTLAVAEKYASDLGGLEKVHEYVHVVYSFSKDFGLNGYRIGVLCSKSSALLAAYGSVSMFTQASNETQQTVADLLVDHDDVKQFVAQSNAMLLETWSKAKRVLHKHGVPVVEPAAGMFFWCNLLRCNDSQQQRQRQLEDETLPCDVEIERQLWTNILDNAKTYITPGFVFRDPGAGWFRICATCAPEDTMLEGLRRIFCTLGRN